MATLAELKADLAMYKEAEKAVLFGAQSYEIAGRKVTKANLAEIRLGIQDLERRIAIASGGQHSQAVFGWSPW